MSGPGPRAVVIGGGLGGLAAGLRLAARGCRVTVCEQGPRPGGKMNLWDPPGFRADTGPSLITLPWMFEELFLSLGRRMDDVLGLVPVRPLAGYVFDDGLRFSHEMDLPSWLETVRRLEGGSAEGYLRVLATGARLFALSRGTFLRHAPGMRPDAESLRCALRFPPPARALRGYRAVVRRGVRHPALRQFLGRYATYVGSSPAAVPAMLLVIPYLENAYGGFHIRGGLYRLIEALLEIGRGLPFECRTGARVEAIVHRAGRVEGVELASGERLEARIVIHNGDASRTDRLLGGPGPGELPARDRSLSGLVFLFALRRRLEGGMHHQVFFSADYEREFDDLFARRVFPGDPTVYVNRPAQSDSGVAPPGGEVLFVMANAPAEAGGWDAAALDAARARVLARLRRGGFPAFEPQVAASEVWTPARFAEAYDLPGGALYGTHSHGPRRAFLRPPIRFRRPRGLYRVGGSTHPGGGTPTVLASARIACEWIRRLEGV